MGFSPPCPGCKAKVSSACQQSHGQAALWLLYRDLWNKKGLVSVCFLNTCKVAWGFFCVVVWLTINLFTVWLPKRIVSAATTFICLPGHPVTSSQSLNLLRNFGLVWDGGLQKVKTPCEIPVFRVSTVLHMPSLTLLLQGLFPYTRHI